MTTFALDYAAIHSIASLHAITVKRTELEVTPILGAIRLTITPTEWVAVATDRYRVAEVRGEMGTYANTLSADEPLVLLLNSAAMLGFAKKVWERDIIQLHVGEDGLGYENEVRVWEEVPFVTGNYPPVERLFGDGDGDDSYTETHGSVHFDAEALASFTKVMTPTLMNTTPVSSRRQDARALRVEFGNMYEMRVTRDADSASFRGRMLQRRTLR